MPARENETGALMHNWLLRGWNMQWFSPALFSSAAGA